MILDGMQDFAAVSDELAECLKVSAMMFCSKRGFQLLSVTALGQMTTSLTQVSREILMFGADVWPFGEDDVPPHDAKIISLATGERVG